MDNKPANPILAILCGGLVAVLIAYGLAFAGMWVSAANVTAPDLPMERGAAAFSRVGLNLYAVQNVTLSGSGLVKSESGLEEPPSLITDTVRLPLSVWVIIPILAMFIGGYIAGAMRRGAGVWGIIVPAVMVGALYALIMFGCSHWVKGMVDSSAIPAISEDVTFNPDPIFLHPQARSVLVNTGALGVSFAFLGGMMASRRERRVAPGKWWACAKAVVITGLIVQILIAGGFGFAVRRIPETVAKPNPVKNEAVSEGATADGAETAPPPAKPVSKGRLLTMTPMAAGLAYSAMHGATLQAQAIVLPEKGESTDLLTAGVNLYGRQTQISGAMIADDKRKSPRTISGGILYLLVGVGALAAFAAGCLALRWGSRDGSVLTALRIAIIWPIYLFAIGFFSRWGWSQLQTVMDVPTETRISIAPHFGVVTLFVAVGVFAAALLGAYVTTAWYSARGGFPYEQ